MTTKKKHRIVVDLVGEEGQQIHDLISYYKTLRRESWTEFILKCIAFYAGSENRQIAEALEYYLEISTPVMGRPPGTPQPPEFLRSQSNRMKEHWAKQKARINEINY